MLTFSYSHNWQKFNNEMNENKLARLDCREMNKMNVKE